MSIKTFMLHKHKECDAFFSQAENAVSENDWPYAGTQWRAFYDEFEEHLQMEESVLFPQFEHATGMTQGPTQVMRMEHAQMRSLCVKLNLSINFQDKDAYLGNAETLMILMQQHNMKEEQMLYPMADRVLPDTESIIDLMSAHES